MAHEIAVEGDVGLTDMYTCIHKNDSGTIKVNIAGGDTWEVFVKANVDNYDIALTEAGDESAIYTGTFPAIAAGDYHVVVYQGDKTESSEQHVMGGESYHWDGTNLLENANTVTIGGTTQTANDNGADINSILTGTVTNAQGADVATDVAAMVDGSSRVDVGSWLGQAVTLSTGNKPDVNIDEISDDTTAPANLELDYDGTGYAGGAIKKKATLMP